MLRRLLEIRTEVNQVLEEWGMDTLLTSDWAKLKNMVKLLGPFAIHTDQLQSDKPVTLTSSAMPAQPGGALADDYCCWETVSSSAAEILARSFH